MVIWKMPQHLSFIIDYSWRLWKMSLLTFPFPYIQCDAIRSDQFVQWCWLVQHKHGIQRWKQHFIPNIYNIWLVNLGLSATHMLICFLVYFIIKNKNHHNKNTNIFFSFSYIWFITLTLSLKALKMLSKMISSEKIFQSECITLCRYPFLNCAGWLHCIVPGWRITT